MTTEAGTKLEAARHALYERVRGLDPVQNVVVIGFTTIASIVFDGLAGQSAELATSLEALRTGDGTSIAAAFDAATEYVAARTTRRPAVLRR